MQIGLVQQGVVLSQWKNTTDAARTLRLQYSDFFERMNSFLFKEKSSVRVVN